MNKSAVVTAMLTFAMCASSCTDRAQQDSEPVRFAQSAGGAASEDAAVPALIDPEPDRAGLRDTSEVDQAIALAVSDPARVRRLFIAALRWEDRLSRMDAADARSRSHAEGESLRAYDAIVHDHPTDTSVAEVLFRAAQLDAHANRMDHARRRYLLLIQRFPSSPFVPFAYLSFGDFFLAQQDYASAAQFYGQVRSMAPRGELGAYTNYQLARSHWGQSRCIEALQCLQLALAAGAASNSVRDAAMRDQASIGNCRTAMPPMNDPASLEAPRAPYTPIESLEEN